MRETYRNGDLITLSANGCDGCSPSAVNGALVHEHGCPDSWRDRTRACYVCGFGFIPTERHAAVCQDCREEGCR